MLSWIPVFGPWFASAVEDSAGERILKQVAGNVATVATFAFVLLILGLAGRFFEVASATSWIVDFIVITYVIQSICGLIGALRTLADFGDSWWVKLSGATLAGALQSAGLPLLGLLLAWIQLGAGRAHLSYEYGGGFFGWLEHNVSAWNPMRWLAGIFA